MDKDTPKPFKNLGFQLKLVDKYPPKPLKNLGFRPIVMDKDPSKPFKKPSKPLIKGAERKDFLVIGVSKTV